MKTIHSFEVPLFVEPSLHFKRFVCEIVPFNVSSIFASCWCDKLTFTFRSKEGKEHTASLRLFPHIFDNERKYKLQKVVSSFASKLNCSMSLVGINCEVHLSLISGSDKLSYTTIYGDDLISILEATVVCNSIAVEIALTNLFTVIDMSSSNR